MNCFKDLEISAYIDDAMEPVERSAFAHHLETCPGCRQRLDAVRSLREGLQQLPQPVLGVDLAARFEGRMRPPEPLRRPVPRAGAGWFGWGTAGLAVAASIASGAWLGGLLVGGASIAPAAGIVRVFDPVPPGGLCAAAELCRVSKGMQ